jgi:hypothetical protein
MTIRSRIRTFLAAGFLGLVLLGAGAIAAASGGSGGAPLAQVHRAYRHVPGIMLTATARSASAGPQTRRFLLALQDGTVSAEEFIGPGRHGLRLVARRPGPTFMRAAGTACWRRLRHSTRRWVLRFRNTPHGSLPRREEMDPRTLLNVGAGFPDEGKTLIRRNKTRAEQLEIETPGGFWFLAGTAVPSHLAPKSFLTITPNPRSHRISSIQVHAPERAVRATLAVKPLSVRPTIPRPTPTC